MDIQPIEDLREVLETEVIDVPTKVEMFFRAHRGFFDIPEKKACFLVGVLVRKLLNIQKWDKKGARPPFLAKLQGLRLNEALIKRLSYEAQHKLEEYDKNFYHKLETVIAQHMIAAGEKWTCTNDAISFYFTMGMNMAGLFKSKKEEDGDEQSHE